MLHFLNSLIALEQGKGGLDKAWKHPLDMKVALNIDLWRRCRELLLLFGESYKRRTDANGGLLIAYVAILTMILILGTAVNSGKLEFQENAFPILLHISTLALLSTFSVALAFEGEAFNLVADETKTVLCSSMIQLEAERNNEKHVLDERAQLNMESARFATAQLHESLTASRTLHPIDVLGLIDLNKTLVMTILFAFLTQITLVLDATTIA